MKKTIKIILVVFYLAVNSYISSSASDVVPKILHTIGANQIANIATYEIIPKFKFLLVSIPDSIWDEYESKYDSSTIYAQIEKELINSFDERQIEEYYKLAQNLMQDFNNDNIPPFEYFLSMINSLDTLVDSLSKMQLFHSTLDETYVQPEHQKINSILNPLLQFFKIDTSNLKISFKNDFLDSLLEKYFYHQHNEEEHKQSDTNEYENTANESLSKVDFNKLLKNWDEIYKVYSESLKILFEYYDNYIKLFTELENLFNNYLKEDTKTPNKKQLEFEKRFQKKLKELERKNKELEKKIKSKLKQLEKKKQSILNGTIIKLPNKTQVENLKRLLKQHYKFTNSLITMKKRIEFEIIEDLQKKNYIQSEVPQNQEMK